MILQVREEGREERPDRFYFYPPLRNRTGSPLVLVEAETHGMSCWPTVFGVFGVFPG